MKSTKDLLDLDFLTYVTTELDVNNVSTGLFSTDLLSYAMSNAKEGNILITVINNKNTLAVASLLDLSCVIICGDQKTNNELKSAALSEEIPIFTTKLTSVELIVNLYKSGFYEV